MKPLTLKRMGNSFLIQQMWQLFNTYFTETAEKLQSNYESEAIQHKLSKLNLLTSIFLTLTDDEEIISVIKELKNKKSSGLDGISSSLIKKCYTHLIKPLTFIINLSLNTGEFPELFKIAKVRPLFKKGSKYEVENYRHISMISTFSKTLEKIVSD
jgi:Notch-like protein